VEGRRICPTTDREKYFEMTILLLEIIDGFEIAIEIFALVIPGVTGIVYVLIGPYVR
jgi:hypothetical protein